jgi:acetylglutamate kinase
MPSITLIKVGGEVVDDDAHLAGLANNIADLVNGGARVVVVHGGGPQVSALQEKLGQRVTKVAGQRVTGADDVYAVTAGLAGVVNTRLCAALLASGVKAFGCHGASGGMIGCVKRPPLEVKGHGVVDYGEVGDVTDVDVAGLVALLDAGLVPVVATLGVQRDTGRLLNVNGDSAAAAVAAAMGAGLVILVTGVGGVFLDHTRPETRFATLTAVQAQQHIDDGVISGGMIPKIVEALGLLARTGGTVAIASATDDGVFAKVAAGDASVGTRLLSA